MCLYYRALRAESSSDRIQGAREASGTMCVYIYIYIYIYIYV